MVTMNTEGLKCYIIDETTLTQRRMERYMGYNKTKCRTNYYFLGEGSDAKTTFAILSNSTLSDDLPKYGRFQVKYSFQTFFILPFLKYHKNREIVNCEYEYGRDKYGSPGYVLKNE